MIEHRTPKATFEGLEELTKTLSKIATFIKISGHEDSFVKIDPVKLLVSRLVDTKIF